MKESRTTALNDGTFRLDIFKDSNVCNRLIELFDRYPSPNPDLMVNFTADKRTGEIKDVYLINKKTNEEIH